MKKYTKICIALFLQIFIFINFSYAQFVTISGNAYYVDNLEPVMSGIVYAYDMGCGLVQTAHCTNGSYILTNVPQGSGQLDLIIQADDELEDFIPTYFPDGINWSEATPVTPITNLSNIDLFVHRFPSGDFPSVSASITGFVSLDGTPIKNAIVHAKIGKEIIGYGVTTSKGEYKIDPLPVGDYILVVHRIGSNVVTLNVTVSAEGLSDINFNLESVNKGNNITANPKEFKLSQNFPNPFNPVTKIEYTLPVSGSVKLSIYNSMGQFVEELVSRYQTAGSYAAEFDGTGLSSGVYLYKLETIGFTKTLKMILVK